MNKKELVYDENIEQIQEIMSVRFKKRDQKKDWTGIFHFIILCYP